MLLVRENWIPMEEASHDEKNKKGVVWALPLGRGKARYECVYVPLEVGLNEEDQ